MTQDYNQPSDPAFKERTAILRQHFLKKQPAKASDFTHQGEKTEGINTGYQAIRELDNHHSYMVKTTLKSHDILEVDSRSDLINEALTGSFYARLLPGRAPEIQLVELQDNNSIGLSSRFFDNYQSFKDYKASNPDSSHPQGFEGVMAVCLWMGEGDFHDGNLGVVKKDNENIFVKIDHGRSGTMQFENGIDAIQKFTMFFQAKGYTDPTALNSYSINPSKFKEALIQMNQITDNEIENLAQQRIYQLQQHGIDFRNLDRTTAVSQLNEQIRKSQWAITVKGKENFKVNTKTHFSNAAEFEEHFIMQIKKQKQAMIEVTDILSLAESLAIKLEASSTKSADEKKWLENFRSNKADWLIELANNSGPVIEHAIEQEGKIGKKDALLYAIENKINIKGLNAIDYAIDNAINIEGKSPIDFAIKHKLEIHETDPIKYAIDHKIKIDGQDPRKYASEHKLKVTYTTPDASGNFYIKKDDPASYKAAPNQYGIEFSLRESLAKNLKIDDKEPITFAIENNLKIKDKDPIVYAREKMLLINKQNPSMYAIENNIPVAGKDPLLYAIEDGVRIKGQDILSHIIKNTKIVPKIEGQDAIKYLTDHQIKISYSDPISYAHNNNLKIDNQDPLAYAAKNNIKVASKNTINYAIGNNLKIDNQDPISYAHNNNLLIDGVKPVKYAIDHKAKINNKDPIEYLVGEQTASLAQASSTVKRFINKISGNKLFKETTKAFEQVKTSLNELDKKPLPKKVTTSIGRAANLTPEATPLLQQGKTNSLTR